MPNYSVKVYIEYVIPNALNPGKPGVVSDVEFVVVSTAKDKSHAFVCQAAAAIAYNRLKNSIPPSLQAKGARVQVAIDPSGKAICTVSP